MIVYNPDEEPGTAAVEEAKAAYGDLGERTFEFARRVVRFYSSLPNKTVHQVLGQQVLRSGTSIGANYQEACGSRSRAEFVSKLGDCLKESLETGYWLRLLASETDSPSGRLDALRDEASQVVAMLTSSIRTAKGLPRNEASPSALEL